MVGGQRKVAVAIVCWWSPNSQPGFWLLTVASRAEWPFRSLRSGGRAGSAPATPPSPPNSVGWAYDEYLEKVRSQFLSLRQPSRKALEIQIVSIE